MPRAKTRKKRLEKQRLQKTSAAADGATNSMRRTGTDAPSADTRRMRTALEQLGVTLSAPHESMRDRALSAGELRLLGMTDAHAQNVRVPAPSRRDAPAPAPAGVRNASRRDAGGSRSAAAGEAPASNGKAVGPPANAAATTGAAASAASAAHARKRAASGGGDARSAGSCGGASRSAGVLTSSRGGTSGAPHVIRDHTGTPMDAGKPGVRSYGRYALARSITIAQALQPLVRKLQTSPSAALASAVRQLIALELSLTRVAAELGVLTGTDPTRVEEEEEDDDEGEDAGDAGEPP